MNACFMEAGGRAINEHPAAWGAVKSLIGEAGCSRSPQRQSISQPWMHCFMGNWDRRRSQIALIKHALSWTATSRALWQGDITTLPIGAIVNDANTKGLGCSHAEYVYIDNSIHCAAGSSLRLACFLSHEKNDGRTNCPPSTSWSSPRSICRVIMWFMSQGLNVISL